VIFGGCLIKEVGAGKGNLADANTIDWSNTVRKIRDEYPDVKRIVPGHGQPGGIELLDYTIKLFDKW
jgi:metallo-beta-lactamase class B